MRYRDVVTPGGGLDGLPGFHVKSPECPHSTHFLQWEDGPTVFRPYPPLEGGNVLPLRYSEQAGDFTPWLVAARMVKMLGVNDKFTCLAHVKNKPFSERGPVDYFVGEMHKAVGKKATNARDYPKEWEDWTKGGKGKGAKLGEVDRFGFMQGMLFENGKKKYVKEGRPDPLHPVLMCITKSARWQVEKQADAEVEGYSGHPEDWVNRFKLGDVISLEAGRPLNFYHVPRTDESNPRYGLRVMENPIPVSLDLVRNEWRDWEDLLVFLTEEEQIELLVRSFPPQPLDFVFTGSQWEDMLPGKVKGTYKSQQQTQPQPGHPGFVQPYGQPGQPAVYGVPVGQPVTHAAPHAVAGHPQAGGIPPAPPAGVAGTDAQTAAVPPVSAPNPGTPVPAQHPSQAQGYVPPPPPAGFQPAQPAAAPAAPAAGDPYAGLSFGTQTAGQPTQQAQTAPAATPPAPPPQTPPQPAPTEAAAPPPAQPPQQPQQPQQPQPQQPQQPTGDPNASGGAFINAMEDLRASRERARQMRETPDG